MTDLRQRLTLATVGDRNFDADMHEAYGVKVVRGRPHPARSFAYLVGSRWVSLPCVTTNLNDAVAFVDSVARGADIELRRQGREWIASVGWSDDFTHRSAALALCLALLQYKAKADDQLKFPSEAVA